MPPLTQMLAAEVSIRKEAAWAISNMTTGGSSEQIKYLVVEQGCIPPMCALLDDDEAGDRIVLVVLEGLQNILNAGDAEAKAQGLAQNVHATYIDEAGGLDKIEQLVEQLDPDEVFTNGQQMSEVGEKATRILETHFGDDFVRAPKVQKKRPKSAMKKC